MPDRREDRRRGDALVELIGRGEFKGRRLLAAVAALVTVVCAIGITDAATGPHVGFGVFYLVPVAVAASVGGTRTAFAIAALSAVSWVLGDRALEDDDAESWVAVVNIVLRFFILGFIVVLLVMIRDAYRAARDSDRRSREFLAFAAHQLRTPTASVSATAQGLLAQGQDPDHEEALVRLVAEASRIGRLVASILRFVRLDQGDAMPRQYIDLCLLCAAEVARHEDMSLPVSIEFAAEAPDALVTHASPHALQEAVGNLIDNARRHASAKVSVTARAADRHGEIVVRDDGPGLPPGAEEQAFEPFVTLDGHAGSGLGLPIARRLVESQGGSLRYLDGRFVIRMPLTR